MPVQVATKSYEAVAEGAAWRLRGCRAPKAEHGREAGGVGGANSGPPTSIKQPDAHRFDRGLSPVRDSELAEDTLDVLLRRRHAPSHAVRDLAIGQALRDQTQHIAIDCGQLIGGPRTGPR